MYYYLLYLRHNELSIYFVELLYTEDGASCSTSSTSVALENDVTIKNYTFIIIAYN